MAGPTRWLTAGDRRIPGPPPRRGAGLSDAVTCVPTARIFVVLWPPAGSHAPEWDGLRGRWLISISGDAWRPPGVAAVPPLCLPTPTLRRKDRLTAWLLSVLLRRGPIDNGLAARFDLPRQPRLLPEVLTVEEGGRSAVRTRTDDSPARPFEIELCWNCCTPAGLRIFRGGRAGSPRNCHSKDGLVRVVGKGDRSVRFPVRGKSPSGGLRRYIGRGPAGVAGSASPPFAAWRPALPPPCGASAWIRRAGLEMLVRLPVWPAFRNGVSPTHLRHSFATHLLEGGRGSGIVQEATRACEHQQRTQLYTHLTGETDQGRLRPSHPPALRERNPAVDGAWKETRMELRGLVDAKDELIVYRAQAATALGADSDGRNGALVFLAGLVIIAHRGIRSALGILLSDSARALPGVAPADRPRLDGDRVSHM